MLSRFLGHCKGSPLWEHNRVFGVEEEFNLIYILKMSFRKMENDQNGRKKRGPHSG